MRIAIQQANQPLTGLSHKCGRCTVNALAQVRRSNNTRRRQASCRMSSSSAESRTRLLTNARSSPPCFLKCSSRDSRVSSPSRLSGSAANRFSDYVCLSYIDHFGGQTGNDRAQIFSEISGSDDDPNTRGNCSKSVGQRNRGNSMKNVHISCAAMLLALCNLTIHFEVRIAPDHWLSHSHERSTKHEPPHRRHHSACLTRQAHCFTSRRSRPVPWTGERPDSRLLP